MKHLPIATRLLILFFVSALSAGVIFAVNERAFPVFGSSWQAKLNCVQSAPDRTWPVPTRLLSLTSVRVAGSLVPRNTRSAPGICFFSALRAARRQITSATFLALVMLEASARSSGRSSLAMALDTTLVCAADRDGSPGVADWAVSGVIINSIVAPNARIAPTIRRLPFYSA